MRHAYRHLPLVPTLPAPKLPAFPAGMQAAPFVLWTRLAMTTWEMLFASAQVISHRTQRMLRAGPLPDARDRREFHLMGQEKVEAAGEAMRAVALKSLSLNQQFGLYLYRQWVSGASAWMSLASSRSATHAATLQGELLRRSVTQAGGAVTQIGDAVARTMHTGLRPIHARATANARRLAKIRK